jgi:hypothetical protein
MEEAKKKSPKKPLLWGGGVLSVAGILTLVLCLVLPATKNTLSGRLTNAKQKDTSLSKSAISSKSVSIYQTFYRSLVPLLFAGEDKNQSFSLVDAFVNLAILTELSPNYQNEITTFFGCSKEELKTAATEIILTTETPYIVSHEGKETVTGGFGLNSVWLAPYLRMQDDVTDTLKTIEDSYYADVFHAKPTSQAINAYNEKMTPSLYGDLPKVNFSTELDAAIVSTFDVYDSFASKETETNRNDYYSKNHQMSFLPKGAEAEKKDYLSRVSYNAHEKIGSSFTGVDSLISSLSFSFYKANEESTSLSSIVKDVVDENYKEKDYGLDGNNKAIIPVCTSKIPYFTNSGSLELLDKYSEMGLSCLKGNDGALASLVKDILEVVFIKQENTSTLNYEGFVSKSLTVTGIYLTSADGTGMNGPTYCYYDYDGDKPFFYSVSRSLRTDNAFVRLPLIYGTIVNPAYSE